VEVADTVALGQDVLVTDSDPAAIERAGLVNHCKLMTYCKVVDRFVEVDVRAANRDHCKGLSVKPSR
jgi:hypothetical protein